ncbi:MAG: ArsA family ATPase [Candidatus Jettenia sp. CY-1]|nr:MAG: ArsA family ATPase [Candidatus Jettenia sp. CY-1]
MQIPLFLTNTTLSLICFGGKGGVGKTTSAVATALYLADKNPQKRILLASLDPAHSLMDSLKNTNDFNNLKVWEIDARISFQKFIEKHSSALKKIINRGSFLDETDISNLLSISLPGIDELMGMIELANLTESNTYDSIILDTAPTGHTMKFMQMPYLVKRWTYVLNLMMEKHRYLSKLYIKRYQPDDADAFIEAFIKGAKKIERMLQDKSCEFVPVMLPEILSMKETQRFLSVLKKYKVPAKTIIINRVYPASDCYFCSTQYSRQAKYIDEIKSSLHGYNLLSMPLCNAEIQGKESLLKFAQVMVNSFHQDDTRERSNLVIHSPVPPLKEITRGEVNDSLQKEVFTAKYKIKGTYPMQNNCYGDGCFVLRKQNIMHADKAFCLAQDNNQGVQNGSLGEFSGDTRLSSLLPKQAGDFPEFPLHKNEPRGIKVFSNGMKRLPALKSSLEFLLFSGKGGVGKTTLACATALSLSNSYPEKRILLFSTDPAHSLSDCLDVVIGGDGLSLNNLSIQEMNAEEEYQKLKHLYSEEIRDFMAVFTKRDASVHVVFEKEIMESLIEITPPGIDEVMAITSIIDYMDKGSFDIFILDTAPTGHFIRFLEMPELTLDWLKFFFNLFLKYKNNVRMPKISAFLVDLSKKIKKLLTLLHDKEKSLFIPIAIPTEMAYEETKDLLEAVKRLKIPIEQGILNMVHPYPKKDIIGAECPICVNRIVYEEKMLYVFKKLFPVDSLCIIHKQEEEIVGIKALQSLGKKLYGDALN